MAVLVALSALAVAAAPVVWAGSQDVPGDRRGWLLACGAALLVALGASGPLRREISAGAYVSACLAVVLFLALALGTVFATAQAADAIRIQRHELPSASATMTACRTTGRELDDQDHVSYTYGCTYHWTVDGRAFSAQRSTDQLYPDGRPTRVWLDGATMITGRPDILAIPIWVAFALVGLLGTLRFGASLAWQVRASGLLP
ncbi:hypothetical protein [Kitasatospora mediocidica]|uniref:hypothetical protein n=1 Tax=Kitasatospora mediocidica TaxID=58352 RepID=UPI0005659ED0|nr:hypothetical protein [Kitasatospora mediocidica]